MLSVALAVAAFAGIFLFGVPFPIIIFGAGLIGFLGSRAGSSLFQVGGGHGAKKGAVVVDSLLGDELPEHARWTVARALRVAAIWLLLWLVPVAAVLLATGVDSTFSQIAIFFSKMAMVTFGSAYAVLAPVEGFGARFDAPVAASVDLWALALSAAAILAIFRIKVGMITAL